MSLPLPPDEYSGVFFLFFCALSLIFSTLRFLLGRVPFCPAEDAHPRQPSTVSSQNSAINRLFFFFPTSPSVLGVGNYLGKNLNK